MKIKFGSFIIPVILLSGLITLRIFGNRYFEELSLKVFDTFQRLTPRVYQDAGVRFIDIDDETLKRYGQWPWPRTLMAKLVDKLKESGTAAVTLDIVFSEPDRTSPANLAQIWGNDAKKPLNEWVKDLPDHDNVFAESIASAKTVTGFILSSQPTNTPPAVKTGIAFAGENPVQYLLPFKGAITNLPQIEKASKGNGSFNFFAETDGIIRRVPLLFRMNDTLYPSLIAETVRVAQDASSIVIKTSGSSGEVSFGEKTGIVSVKIGAFQIPTDDQGRIWLYDTGKISTRTIPAWKILEASANSDIEGGIAVVGSSAGGLKDLRATPLNPVASGTEVHIQLIEQILTGNFLTRPDWAVGAEMLYLFVMGFLLIILLPFAGALPCALLSLLAAAAALGGSYYAFNYLHLLLDPVLPSAAVLILYLAVSLMNYLREEKEKRHVRDAFGRYLSPSLVKQLANHPEKLKLGGETRPMTILFSDIRSFTTIAERMNASELTHFMNQYLTSMTDVILKHGGTIDKYIGDSIMAFWNAPLDDKDHAKHACEAAVAMHKELAALNQRRHLESQAKHGIFVPIKMGIGINTGSCSVGNMGSSQRFDYSVLGDSVNLASRIESLSKIYGLGLLIGENTFDAVQPGNALEVDLILVKGKNQPSRIYTLFELENHDALCCFEDLKTKHKELLSAYRAREWDKAESIARQCLDRRYDLIPLRNLYQTYLTRIEAFRKTPPPADWQGVWEALTK